MVSSLRECICTRQAGFSRDDFRLSALPQVSGAVSRSLSGLDVTVILIVVLALVAAVVLTAVWSPDREQRKDARDVLDRIMRWRW